MAELLFFPFNHKYVSPTKDMKSGIQTEIPYDM